MESHHAMIPPRARRSDPGTSHEAARSMHHAAATQRGSIWDALRAQGPAGRFTLAARTGLTDLQVARRMHELVDRGVAEVVPDATERTPSGRAGQVWRARA